MKIFNQTRKVVKKQKNRKSPQTNVLVITLVILGKLRKYSKTRSVSSVQKLSTLLRNTFIFFYQVQGLH